MVNLKNSIISLTLILFGSEATCWSQANNVQLNVLFIFADDLSTSIPTYGINGAITPNIDKLAQRGRLFSNAYCQTPLCNPSRASVMTGRYPHELKIWTNEPHFRGKYPYIKTLPERFKSAGYYAVGIGKVFHNWAQSLEGDTQSWSYPQVNHWGAHYYDWYISGRRYEFHMDVKKGPSIQCEDVPDEAYVDGRIANLAIESLRELQESPFFLAVGFWKPHLPFNAPKKYWDLYDRNNLPLLKYTNPVDGIPELAYVNSDEARSYTDVPGEGTIPDEKKREMRHGYFAAISYLDAQIGKVVDELERLDLAKNTIIVFLSDHGYHSGEHGQFGKWTNFEIGSKVPLIIVVPNNPQPGKASASLVELVDLYPTLLDLCFIELPESKYEPSGISLSPIIYNPDAHIKKSAISQTTRPLKAGSEFTIIGSSIRTQQYRYNIWMQRKDGRVIAEELYDLSDDSYKVDNIVSDPRMREIKNELNTKLKERLLK